jgi:ribosomal protein L18E
MPGKNKALTTTYSETLRKLEHRLQDARQREDFDAMESIQKDIEKLQRDVRVNKVSERETDSDDDDIVMVVMTVVAWPPCVVDLFRSCTARTTGCLWT